jgi:hypothetical protein
MATISQFAVSEDDSEEDTSFETDDYFQYRTMDTKMYVTFIVYKHNI